MEKRYYNGVSLFKAISIAFIVAVHVKPFYEFCEPLGYICSGVIARVALSFFFLASGFLFGKSVQNARAEGKSGGAALARRVLGIARLYIIWSLIYLPFSGIFREFAASAGTSQAPGVWLKYLLMFFITGTYEHLWFIPALLISLAISYALSRRGALPLALGVLLYVVFLLGTAYSFVGEKTFLQGFFVSGFFGTLRRIFGSGFIFTAAGYYFSQINPDKLARINRRAIIPICLLYLAEFAVLGFAVKGASTVITLMLPLATASLFVFSTGLRLKKLDGSAKFLGFLSSGVYFSHMLFMLIISGAAKAFLGIELTKGGNLATLYYILTLAVSVIFCILIDRVNKKQTLTKLLN